MGTFLSFLSSAVGGSLLGSVLSIVNGWSETYRKQKELEMQIRLAESSAAAQAFANSQATNTSAFVVPDGIWVWVKSFIALVLGCVEAFRQFTRPGLTWGLIVFLWFAYNGADASARASLLDQITFGAFTALLWWFGERMNSRKAAK